MRTTTSYGANLLLATLLTVGCLGNANAAPIFADDFEDRVKDQALIGNDWTWFDQTYGGDTCTGNPTGEYGPWSDNDPSDYPADNRNYWTASADQGFGDSYYRAGLEVPAWEGALGNMLRIYGNQYNGAPTCQRVLVFKESAIQAAGTHIFSFEVAQDRYGAPANGEITAAFVKVLKSSDSSYATLLFDTTNTTPPQASAPDNVKTRFQYLEFDIPQEWVGELLQFGFYNDLTPQLGQSWTTSAALYDNVTLAEKETGSAEYTVKTTWLVTDNELSDIDLNVEVTVSCEAPILDHELTGGATISVSDREIVVLLDDGDSVTVEAETISGTTQCRASQNIKQSGTVSAGTESCSGQILSEGDMANCEFKNTLFFEGIPTLNQAGTAILALLLLGMGMIAMRRFN